VAARRGYCWRHQGHHGRSAHGQPARGRNGSYTALLAQMSTFSRRSDYADLCKLTYHSSRQTRADRAAERRESPLRSAHVAADLYASGCSVLSQRWRPERSRCRSGESMRGRAGWRPDHVMAGPRADSRVPEGGPAELRRRRGLAAPGRVDRYTEDPRPARRRPFGSGEATSSSEPASTSVVVCGVPRDRGGNTAGEPAGLRR
jgi:hypothetical protein